MTNTKQKSSGESFEKNESKRSKHPFLYKTNSNKDDDHWQFFFSISTISIGGGRGRYRVIEKYSFKALRKVATFNKVHSPSQFDSFFKIKKNHLNVTFFLKLRWSWGLVSILFLQSFYWCICLHNSCHVCFFISQADTRKPDCLMPKQRFPSNLPSGFC